MNLRALWFLFASFAVLCVFALRILRSEFTAQRRKEPQSSQRKIRTAKLAKERSAPQSSQRILRRNGGRWFNRDPDHVLFAIIYERDVRSVQLLTVQLC